jgi:phosphoribosylglycinamide formyltransferase 1
MSNPEQPRKRLGVLLSGRGSNFEAIARNCASGALQADIAVVVSNRPEAAGLETARGLGLRAVAVPGKGVPRLDHDKMVAAELQKAEVDLVVLAGYMRILTEWFIQQFPLRIVNIHPSLLPAFPGLDAQHQAWEYGVRYAGCTVHFVNEQMDSGPILGQAVVPVLEADTADSLSARILEQEHRLYSEMIAKVLAGGWRIEGRRVCFDGDATG